MQWDVAEVDSAPERRGLGWQRLWRFRTKAPWVCGKEVAPGLQLPGGCQSVTREARGKRQ